MRFASYKRLTLILLLAVTAAQAAFAVSLFSRKNPWPNIMPPPPVQFAQFYGFGDPTLAYYVISYFLQNAGNTNGNYESLLKYDYDRLNGWLFASEALDARGHAIPYLATNYFGAVKDDQKRAKLVDYLAVAGRRTEPEKWRWLAYAAMYAQMAGQMDRALELAEEFGRCGTMLDELLFYVGVAELACIRRQEFLMRAQDVAV